MLISVIIPCYNSELTLDSCLYSVFHQTHTELEIICINDGSTDDTLNKLYLLKDSSPFPFYILNQENKGACSARNAGVEISKGEYLQFLDSDDELRPRKIENQVQIIKENPNVDIIFAPYVKRRRQSKHMVEVYTNDQWTALIIGRVGCTCSNLFRKKIIVDNNSWNENCISSQEIDLMFRILQNRLSVFFEENSFTIVNERTSGSISSTNKVENWERAIQLRLKIKEYLIANNKLTRERENGLKQILFDCIRMMYYEDKRKAIMYFNQLIKNKYKPMKSLATSRLYVFFYSFLGFQRTQKLFARFRKKIII